MDDISSTKKTTLLNITKINAIFLKAKNLIAEKISHLSAEGVGWLGLILIHSATIPSLLALILAISDTLPSLDIILFVWTGLLLFFIKSLIKRDMLGIITNGLGFFVQAVLLGMVVFK